MPLIEVKLTSHEESEFGGLLIDACARSMLQRYVPAGDSDDAVSRPTELAQQITRDVVAAIKEQARAATPGIVESVLTEQVKLTDEWGSTKHAKSVRQIIAEEVKRELYNSNGRGHSGSDCVLNKIIREEVQRALKDELGEALNTAKQVVLDAITGVATEEIRRRVGAVIELPKPAV